jgi:ATP-dependent DNA helicase RecG
MGRSFKSLERVIKLESDQGYQDRAVVGGIQQFAALWVSQAREDAVDEADLAFIEQVAETLNGYGQLPGTEARATALATLNEKLRARAERLGEPATTPAAARQPSAPPPATKKALPAEDEAGVQDSDDVEDDVETVVANPELLLQPVTEIRGVGRVVGERLATLGLEHIKDLPDCPLERR